MSWISFASAAGVAPNRDFLMEVLGATPGGTTVTSGLSANTMGTYTQIPGGGVGGVTQYDWKAFIFCVSQAETNTSRSLAKISIDGGATDFHPPIFAHVGSTGGWQMNYIPMAVSAGADFRVATQSTSATDDLKFMVFGLRDQVSGPAGYTIAEEVAAASTAGSRAGTTSISIVTNDTSFTQINAGLAQSYGAFLVSIDPTAAFTTAQFALLRLAYGVGNTVIGLRPFYASALTVAIPRFTETFEASVASGQPMSINVQAAIASDAIYANVIGYR